MLSSPDCPSLVMTPPSGMPPRSQRLSETHALLCAGIHTRSQEAGRRNACLWYKPITFIIFS